VSIRERFLQDFKGQPLQLVSSLYAVTPAAVAGHLKSMSP